MTEKVELVCALLPVSSSLYDIYNKSFPPQEEGNSCYQYIWLKKINNITTVPLKWINRSLKSLKYSLLRAVSKANGLDFVTLQPQRIAYVSRQVRVLSTFLVSKS